MTLLTSTAHTGTDYRAETNRIRLKNLDTGEYLHLSGDGATKNKNHSWSGTRRQANTLAQRAAARGEPFPYRKVRATAQKEIMRSKRLNGAD